LTRILQGPCTDDTLVIVNTVHLNAVCHGCTAKPEVIIVEPLTVSQWSQPISAVCGPDAIAQSTAAAPTTQGLGVQPTDPFHLGHTFSMAPRTFDPSQLPSIPPDGIFTPSEGMGLYESNAQSIPFNSFAALESNPLSFFPPSFQHFPSQKRVSPSLPAQDERLKRRKLETGDNHLVSQQVGARQADHRTVAVTGNVQTTELNLPAANQGPANASIYPIPSSSSHRPQGISDSEYIRLLQAKIAEGDVQSLHF